ncbi:MAG TPA: hypothetical protein VGR03_09555 [Candidatus Acidoferrum sp.]|nr:hypothetical protein [Candidatus Acidoferrum sp.]
MAEQIAAGEQGAASASPLRIGIMVDSLIAPLWLAKIISDIQESSFAKIVLVVLNAAPPETKKKPMRDRLKGYWARGLFEHYERWDRQRNHAALDAFTETDVSAALKHVPTLPVVPIRKRFVDRFAPEDIASIRQANLDVLFRFGFRIIKGEILSTARFGVWSIHHGDNREYRGAAPGFWEMYERNPVTGSILQVLNESLDGGKVLYRSLSATDFGSLHSTNNSMYWKTADFAIRRLRDLHRFGWNYIQSLEEFNEPVKYTKQIYRTPATPAMVRFLTRQAGRKLARRARSLLVSERPQWFIASRARTGSRTALTDRSGFRAVVAPHGRFYADPFLIKRNGTNYLFFEDFEVAKDRAVISCMEVGKDGTLGVPRTALETDYHLSYPFVFEHRGEVYLIPETRTRKRIELYRAAEFPLKWVLVKMLAENVQAVDSTLHQSAGKLWLFANIAVPGASTFDELHLFLADSLQGEWTPHPKNPIVSDVRRARPAGALFFENGKLIRPSQDCTVRYGRAMTLNEVQVLSATDYREAPVGRIEPDWHPGIVCTHTYNRNEEFEVLDAMEIKRGLRFFTP